MSEENKVPTEKLSKALEALQDIAKGHNSRGTNTTKVESMRDASAGAGSDAGSTQVHHTPSNSDPQGWAGSRASSVPEDGASDAVDANGTDYKGGAKMMKSILQKLAKGLPLNAEEMAFYSEVAKGGFDPEALSEEDDDKKEDAKKAMDKKEDEEEDTKKSLSDYASENEDVNKGLEVSSFLKGWVDTQTQALSSVESRLVKSIQGLQAKAEASAEEQQAFNSELAKSVAALAEVLSLQAQRLEQVESTPARGPKSVSGAAAVEKSFGAGGAAAPADESLNKSQILDTMSDMVQKGKLSATEVIKFESTSQLTPQLQEQVLAHRAGR